MLAGGHFYFIRKGLTLFCSQGSIELAAGGQSPVAFPIIRKTYFSDMIDAEIAEGVAPYRDNGKPIERTFEDN